MTITLTTYGSKKRPKSLGLGVFDGIHVGHQGLLAQCDALLTFNPHPITIIQNHITVERLTTIKEMTHYVDLLYVLEFNKNVANLSAYDFLNLVILNKINPENVVIGYDYYFGKNKEGTPSLFKKWAQQHNISLTIVDPIKNETKAIKSKSIRSEIKQGDFNQAIKDLGHSYLMIGQVIKGDNRGKSLGFPTANLEFPDEKLIPQHGVYKGKISYENQSYQAMIYIGNKPTFNTTTTSVEAFLLDFNGDLYDKTVNLFIEAYLRPEKQFQSKKDLINQIKTDIHAAFNT
tara:strand:+ start:273 stop:1139 length:867 start_codon:yes stop_codon:yes gene_type:complete